MDEPQNGGSATGLSRSRRLVVLAICCFSLLIVGLDATIVNVALPAIRSDLNASVSGLQWVIDAYTLVLASLLMLAGSTADRIGRKRIFRAGLVVFSLGSLLCGLAPSLELLIAARVLQAIGGSMLNPVAMSIIRNVFDDPRERAQAIGAWGAMFGLSMALGPVVGGALVDSVGWRSVFFVNVPCGLVIAAAAWQIMPSVPRRAGTRLDITGSVVLFAGLLCLIGPLLFGHDVGWAPWLWAVMAGGGVILVAFLKLEHAVARAGGMPLIDLTLLADTAFLRGLGAALFFFAANLSFYLVMTLFMQRGLKIPPLAAGLAFIPLALAFVVASRHSGARAKHRGTKVLLEGCALQIAGLFALALMATMIDAPTPVALALIMLIFGYGQGLVMAPLSGAVLSTVKPVAAGSASGIYGTIAQIGNAAGVAAIGAVFFAIESLQSARAGFLVSLALFVTLIMMSAAFLTWMRRASARS